MSFIRNILAIIGLIAIVGGAYAYVKFGPMLTQMVGMASEMAALEQFDPKAKDVYMEMWNKLKETGNSADATVWKVPLADGVSPEDAEQAMKSVANELNMKAVGELPLSEQVKLMTDKEQRLLKIYQFCDPLTAMTMVDFSDAFAAYLPCRIAMVQDKDGKYNLYALNMDMMIHGGKPLPPELFKEADKVRTSIRAIMERGAAGEF